jgi:hypothetical protein
VTRIEHILTIVAEECAEVAQRCSKALRFGLGEIEPGHHATNAARIYQEYADLRAAMEILHQLVPGMGKDLPSLGAMVDAKHLKIAEFLQYSARGGTLSDPSPRELSNYGFEGWIFGNNYRRRGRVMTGAGKDGEPWYQADDGTQWSALDVTFRPDLVQPAKTCEYRLVFSGLDEDETGLCGKRLPCPDHQS